MPKTTAQRWKFSIPKMLLPVLSDISMVQGGSFNQNTVNSLGKSDAHTQTHIYTYYIYIHTHTYIHMYLERDRYRYRLDIHNDTGVWS
jgi:hypothetical protein